jgi:hypothetical protein
MFHGLIPIALWSQLLVTVADGPPTIDIQKLCRASANALFSVSSNPAAIDSCISDEQAAREQLTKSWESFSAGDRSFCVLPREYLPSYIEWLTCLQMERDVKKIRTGQSPGQSATEHQDQPPEQSQEHTEPNAPLRSLRSRPAHVPHVAVRKSKL